MKKNIKWHGTIFKSPVQSVENCQIQICGKSEGFIRTWITGPAYVSLPTTNLSNQEHHQKYFDSIFCKIVSGHLDWWMTSKWKIKLTDGRVCHTPQEITPNSFLIKRQIFHLQEILNQRIRSFRWDRGMKKYEFFLNINHNYLKYTMMLTVKI